MRRKHFFVERIAYFGPCLSDVKSGLPLILAAMLLVSLVSPTVAAVFASPSVSIPLEGFRWNRFPLKVLIDMNEWSTPDYAVAVREALDSWMHSIWNYTNSFGGTSLNAIRYTFYMSTVNATRSYDVFITFAPDEIPPNSGIVGVTHTSWDTVTQEPIPPISINLTTFYRTSFTLFVKNVAMHEFGHALGLGHASSQSTSNGPEVMYPSSTKDEVTYPSTLDIYGLTKLYEGNFDQTIQLPESIPYEMLSDGSIAPPTTTLFGVLIGYLIVIIALLIVLVISLTLWKTSRKTKLPETTTEAPPNPTMQIYAEK